jgi:putative membrane protein
MWYGWNEGMGWMMVFGGLFSLAFLVGLVLLVIWGVNQITRRPSSPTDNSTDGALDIARQRYARGELSLEQFEEIKYNLTKSK